jgi:hypothetical protein
MRASSRHVAEWVPASDLPLFELKYTPIRAPKRVAETSAEAYRELQPTLNAREQSVLNALRTFEQPPTAYEIAKQMMARGIIKDVNGARPRLTALYQRGLVERCDKRRCSITGQCAFTWRVR